MLISKPSFEAFWGHLRNFQTWHFRKAPKILHIRRWCFGFGILDETVLQALSCCQEHVIWATFGSNAYGKSSVIRIYPGKVSMCILFLSYTFLWLNTFNESCSIPSVFCCQPLSSFIGATDLLHLLFNGSLAAATERESITVQTPHFKSHLAI